MTSPRPRFLFDLASPECWLAAERVNTMLPAPPEWVPVLAPPAPVDRELVEQLAAERGLLEVRWPAVVPADARDALLAATFAKGSGRAVAFSLAAFRHAFAAGRDLAREDTILIAAAAAELHPTAVLKGMRLKGTARKLEEASREVARVPALEVGERWFFGDAGLEEAAGALAS